MDIYRSISTNKQSIRTKNAHTPWNSQRTTPNQTVRVKACHSLCTPLAPFGIAKAVRDTPAPNPHSPPPPGRTRSPCSSFSGPQGALTSSFPGRNLASRPPSGCPRSAALRHRLARASYQPAAQTCCLVFHHLRCLPLCQPSAASRFPSVSTSVEGPACTIGYYG